MNIREAKKQVREILGRMVLEHAPEIVLKGGYVPRVKIGTELQPLAYIPVSADEMRMMAQAVMLPQQWESFISSEGGIFDFQLLALGIGRFRVAAAGSGPTLTLSIKPIDRPTDGAYVPFVPADHPPSLSAEAIPEI